MLTYFVLAMSGIFLFVSIFISDLVMIKISGHHIIHPAYWSGLSVVPVVLLAYVFGGISIHLTAGIFIEKKTQYLIWTSGIAAVSNVVANYFLIPQYGFMGAAYATLLAYALGAFVLFIVVQRVYPVQYEYVRLFKIALSIGIVYYAKMLAVANGAATLSIKIGILCSWLVILLLLGFFSSGELSRLAGLFGRRTSKPE